MEWSPQSSCAPPRGFDRAPTVLDEEVWRTYKSSIRQNDESQRVKRVAVFLVVSFACSSDTFAVLRPLFAIKPEPPFAKADGKQ
jgi:hypothetical protein